MLPLLSLHAIAATRGDGLRPELLALFERRAVLPQMSPIASEPVSGDPCMSQPANGEVDGHAYGQRGRTRGGGQG
jgi:hypothetical protein